MGLLQYVRVLLLRTVRGELLAVLLLVCSCCSRTYVLSYVAFCTDRIFAIHSVTLTQQQNTVPVQYRYIMRCDPPYVPVLEDHEPPSSVVPLPNSSLPGKVQYVNGKCNPCFTG